MTITLIILIVTTLAVGAGAAWMTGRAAALTWRPYWMAVLYFVPLTFGFRFIYYVFAHGQFLTLTGVAASFVYIFVIGSVAFRVTKAGLMARQYPWLYQRTSPFTWAPRNSGAVSPEAGR